MPLIDTIMKDLKDAMKAKDLITRDTLRMVKAALTEAEMAKGEKLSEDDELDVLSRAVKTRTDSAKQYEEGDRQDLADKEKAEISVIQRYLPKPMSEGEIREAMKGLAEELGATSMKDMGKLMGAVTSRYRGRIDGKVASKLAREILA